MVPVSVFNLFEATTKDTTEEVARPIAAIFVVAYNIVDMVAVTRIFALHIGKTG